jgi:hypothetical protein
LKSRTNLIDDGGLEIDEDSSGDVLASAGFVEEGVEGVITTTDGLVGGHLSVGLDTVLEAVKLPASVTGLDTGLAYSSKKTRK